MSAAILHRHRRTSILALIGLAVTAALLLASMVTAAPSSQPLPRAAKELLGAVQGLNDGGAGAESDEIRAALAQFNDARNAPGLAAQGGYTAAQDYADSLAVKAGTWQELTKLPYNSDDHRYFDYYANTSGGSSFVTGRVQAMASSASYVFAGGAAGGVYRKPLAGGSWELISGNVPALTTGALAYRNGTLWYATGDGSSGGTTYSGDGIWVATGIDGAQPGGGFTWQRVNVADPTLDSQGNTINNGQHIFDGAVINQLRFSNNWVYAATDYGVWRHSESDLGANWHPVFVPSPSALPSTETNKPASAVSNYTSDIAIDPSDPNHAVVAYGWVVGGGANGWYDGHFANGKWTFTRSSVGGAINPKDIGRTTFAWANDGTGSGRLYALVHNPDHAATGVSYSELGGVFMSTKGVSGPWSKIADSQKLANAGSALDPTFPHAGSFNGGYQPGVQAWYNQFLTVDPNNAKHVFVGLEEVYETRNAGNNWNTVAPYWNFNFGCWASQPNTTSEQVGCPIAPHSDQHAVTIAPNGRVYIGNDGGVYSRPVNSNSYQNGHGADWVSETASDTPDFLQYYSVAIGKVNADKVGANPVIANRKNAGSIVSGGLQDNGGSILFVDGSGADTQMGSNFGGDGGDSLVDPNDGCRIVQEYTELSMRATNTCAATSDIDAFLDTSKATTRDIAPPETLAQFISPFAADHTNINNWLAGGQHVWLNTMGFNITSGGDWTQLVTLGTNPAGTALRQSTAVAASGGQGIVGFCGSCATGAFESGFAYGALATNDQKNNGWTIINVQDAAVTNHPSGQPQTLPTRWIAGADVFQDADGHTHYLLGFNGFGRRWVEGPGAGIGHIFEATDADPSQWTDLSGDPETAADALPDAPVSAVKHLTNGDIVAGTDIGVFYGTTGGANGAYSWQRLGDNLPTTVITDLEPGPGDGFLYAATYGRGIWRIALPSLPSYSGGTSCQDTWWNDKEQPTEPCDPPAGSGSTSGGGSTPPSGGSGGGSTAGGNGNGKGGGSGGNGGGGKGHGKT